MRICLFFIVMTLSRVILSSPQIVRVITLPKALFESSGLIYVKPYLWTLVDDKDTHLYAIYPNTGKVVKRLKLLGVKNRDWESIAQDRHRIYVGDFGNNSGKRRWSTIYYFSKSKLQQASIRRINRIVFRYPGQTGKQVAYQHDFDTEAMVAAPHYLLLFTKNWASGNSNVYTVPKRSGRYEARYIMSLKTPGLITGAETFSQKLWLSGYRLTPLGFNVFLGSGRFISSRAHPLAEMHYASVNMSCQAEGLAIRRASGWLVCEGDWHNKQDLAKLYYLKLSGIEK